MPLVKINGTEHRAQDFELNPATIQCLWRMEDHHFWHHQRNGWILDALRTYAPPAPCAVLEVGCGSGAVTRAIEAAGYSTTGVDTAELLAQKAHERCPASTIVVGDVAQLPEGCRGPFQVIGFFDVLEHLDKPAELLRAALRWAAPGALLIATVPALRSLHTVIDDLSGHKQRYERGELSALLASVGLERVVEHGIFSSTLAIQRLERRAKKADQDLSTPEARCAIMVQALRVPPRPINAALGMLVRAERLLGLKAARNRTGASILAVGFCSSTQ